MGAVLLAAGAKNKRSSLPYARMMIHQPWGSGLQGQATDIDIATKELLRSRDIMVDIFVKHTGHSKQKLHKDIERNYFMSALEAKEYGLIDEVITSRHEIKAKSKKDG